jgi:hypothetical protein
MLEEVVEVGKCEVEQSLGLSDVDVNDAGYLLSTLANA